MKKDALEFLAALATKGLAVQPLPSDAHAERWLVNGDPLEFPIRVPPRNHHVGDLDEVIALATRFGPPAEVATAEVVAAEYTHHPVVWYDETRVVLVIDDDGHRHAKATLVLEFSDVFRTVKALRADSAWFTQADFIMLLRHDLAAALNPDILLNKVRRVEVSARGTSEIKRGQESMGASINSAVGKNEQPPEQVDLQLPVYKTPGERALYTVGCTVDFEVSRPSAPFRLVPLPDEIERVQNLAMLSIRGRLIGGLPETVPCYYGSP